MDTLNKTKAQIKTETARMSEVAKGATFKFINKGHKAADDLCDSGIKKIRAVESEVNHYSNELVDSIRSHPLKAILVAGGIGALLSLIWK